MSLHSFGTVLFEMPDKPMTCASSSTRRVETPPIHASWITAANAFPDVLRGSRKPGKQLPCRSLGTLRFSRSKWVSGARSRYPLRHVVHSLLRSCLPAPVRPSTSASIRSCSTASATARRKSAPSCLAKSSERSMLVLVIGGSVGFVVEVANSTRPYTSMATRELHRRRHRNYTTSSDTNYER